MKIDAVSEHRVDAKDFREELKIEEGEKLVFNIWVASKTPKDDTKDWKRIGVITLDTSVTSLSCDTRLHFHHPKWREE
ncbi:MAG: hypothetical protein Q9M40_13300 [Sulfurimonas sp.]|nr:hypothetical protein [Sulfurimonas sp.]